MQELLQWPGHEKWTAFSECLARDFQNSWDKVVQVDYSEKEQRTDANFDKAVDRLISKFLNCENPRDVMYT